MIEACDLGESDYQTTLPLTKWSDDLQIGSRETQVTGDEKNSQMRTLPVNSAANEYSGLPGVVFGIHGLINGPLSRYTISH